uniref:Si:ch211-225p5.8 n=1 Tax=Cynoglossus semilaevis TaxID=244447 RepID=A0A3P8W3L2_CYNSE
MHGLYSLFGLIITGLHIVNSPTSTLPLTIMLSVFFFCQQKLSRHFLCICYVGCRHCPCGMQLRAETIHEQFNGRMEWQGTKKSDIQSGTIYIHNMTFNDTGTYRCTFQRTIFLVQNDVHHIVEKHVELSVVKVANREITSLISELMMYVLILVLQLWLILVLVSCYKKISKEYEAREAKLAPREETNELLEKEDPRLLS